MDTLVLKFRSKVSIFLYGKMLYSEDVENIALIQTKEGRTQMKKILKALSMEKDVLGSRIRNVSIPTCSGGNPCKGVGGGGC